MSHPILKYKGKIVPIETASKYAFKNGEREYEVWKDGEFIHTQVLRSVDFREGIGTTFKTITNGKPLDWTIPGGKFSWMV